MNESSLGARDAAELRVSGADFRDVMFYVEAKKPSGAGNKDSYFRRFDTAGTAVGNRSEFGFSKLNQCLYCWSFAFHRGSMRLSIARRLILSM